MTTKCPRCNLENLVKTYGIWKCPGCGFIPDTRELTLSYSKKNKKSIKISNETVTTETTIFPMNPFKSTVRKSEKKQVIAHRKSDDKQFLEGLLKSVDRSSDASKWADLSKVGTEIRKIQPDFDVRSYGCKKFSELIQKTGLFDIREEQSHNVRFLFVRKKAN